MPLQLLSIIQLCMQVLFSMCPCSLEGIKTFQDSQDSSRNAESRFFSLLLIHSILKYNNALLSHLRNTVLMGFETLLSPLSFTPKLNHLF